MGTSTTRKMSRFRSGSPLPRPTVVAPFKLDITSLIISSSALCICSKGARRFKESACWPASMDNEIAFRSPNLRRNTEPLPLPGRNYFFCSGTWFKRPLPVTAEIRLSNTSNSIYLSAQFSCSCDCIRRLSRRETNVPSSEYPWSLYPYGGGW